MRLHGSVPLAALAVACCCLSSVTMAQVLPQSQTDSPWFKAGLESINAKVGARSGARAKNVILFVGDGMGISTLTASRILEGQLDGMPGEENYLSFETFPDTALELAEIKGYATGIVSTARITHATPAATYAKSVDRNWEDISDMPGEAVAAGCEDIASQLIAFEDRVEARFGNVDINGIDVVMGGVRRHFLPDTQQASSPDATSAVEGDRTDNRNLVEEWLVRYPDGMYVYDKAGFDAIGPDASRVFALFNESHMQYEQDRANDIAGEPSLSEMTRKAIGILDNNPNGYFLTVGSGRIDHAHHGGNAQGALIETIEFARAVKVAMDATNPADTLIIVTADHSHVFTISGYPKRGNPILGKVVPTGQDEPALATDNMPYTTLGYTNGRGFRNLGSETDVDITYIIDIMPGRMDLTNVDTTAPGFFQETLIPLVSETHAGEDVGVYASGPGASLVSGTNEQSVIFHVMDYAAQLVNRAEAALGE